MGAEAQMNSPANQTKITGMKPPLLLPLAPEATEDLEEIHVPLDPDGPPPDVSKLPLWAQKTVTAAYWKERAKRRPVRQTFFGNDCPPGPGWVYVVQYLARLYGLEGKEPDWRNDATIQPYGFRTEAAAQAEAQRRRSLECGPKGHEFRVHRKWVGDHNPAGEAWFADQ
jgi:hypothetical protein